MEAHEPRLLEPTATPVLTGETMIRDVASGETRTMDFWIAERMTGELRDRGECTEAIINAVARGDLVVDF